MLSIISLATALSAAPLAKPDHPISTGLTPKPVSDKALQVEFARSITISIELAAASPLVLDYAALTGGEWQRQPMPGSTIQPGDVVTLVSGAENPFDPLGGRIVFSLPSGADFTIEFEWATGRSVTCTGNDASLDTVAVNIELVNTMSNTPTCGVTITNAVNG